MFAPPRFVAGPPAVFVGVSPRRRLPVVPHCCRCCCLLLAGLSTAGHGAAEAEAGTIFWGTEAYVRNESSQGRIWGPEIALLAGVFREGFQPTLENRNEWRDHWRELGRGRYDAGEGRFGGVLDPARTALPAGYARQVYFWAQDDERIVRGPEWLLVTQSSWQWPAATPVQPLVWTAGDAGVVIVGELHGEGEPRLRSAAVAPVPEAPDAWLARHFTEEAATPGWDDDGDQDGMTNRVEYALGRDPRRADGPGTPELVPEDGKLVVRLARNPFSSAKATLEYSGDLQTWRPADGVFRIATDRPDLLELQEERPAGEGRRFVRFQFQFQSQPEAQAK